MVDGLFCNAFDYLWNLEGFAFLWSKYFWHYEMVKKLLMYS